MFGHVAALFSIVIVALHLTGKMHAVGGWFDIGIDPRHWLFLLALPLVGCVGYVMLRDR